MLKIDVYQHGAGYKVRLHHHPSEVTAECSDDCDEYSVDRCYPQRGASPAEARLLIVTAVQRALDSSVISHREFLRLLGDDVPLW